jgi:hypothetical protein
MMIGVETHRQLSWYSLLEFLLEGLPSLPAASLFISWHKLFPSLFLLPINRESSLQLASQGHTTNPVAQVLPVLSPARTRDGRVGLRNVSVQGFTCSGEDGNHVFGEFPLAAQLLVLSTLCSSGVVFTASFLHCTERNDYTDRHHVSFGWNRLCCRV